MANPEPSIKRTKYLKVPDRLNALSYALILKDDDKKSIEADDGQNVAIEVPEEKRRVSTTSAESSSSSPINSSKLLNRRKSQVSGPLFAPP